MALCKELSSSARYSARTNDAFISTFRSLRRTARFFTNFVACRGVRAPVTNGTNAAFKQDREWRIRAVQFDESANLQRFYATCEEGLEEILAAELFSPLINASQVELGFGGMSFVCTQKTGYNANLWLRTADRVLCELARGLLPPKDRSGVYDFVRAAADWPLLLVDDATPQISQSAKRYKLRKFAVQIKLQNSAEKQASILASVSNAIWDSLRDGCGRQWPEKEDAVSVPLVFHVDGDSAVLYRDMSGVSLYKRGYGDTTTTMVQSKEGLAAAVLTIAGWNPMVSGFGEANKNSTQDKNRVLLDPFCGTGTFLIQAALMASHVAPGLMRRHWPFQTWHDYDQRAWTECRDAAASMQVSSVSSAARFIGNDMNEGALAKCKRFARAAGVLHLLDLSCETSRHYRPPCTPSLVVTNPPCAPPLTYSSLRGEDERLRTLWQGFGQFLKSQCRGADVYVVSENDWLTHALHMLPDRKWDIQPHKQWRGKLSGTRNEKLFGSQERKLLHYYVQSRRAQGNPLSAIPFSPLSPNSIQPGLLCENTEFQHWR